MAALACVLLCLLAVAAAQSGPSKPGFVTRSGARLMLDGSVFRFSGANIFWGGLDEDGRIGYTYPTEFRVNAALQTASDMGATVVRCQTCGISTGSSLSVEPSLGTFNQAALRHIDYFIAQAKKDGIRLVIPLTDTFDYYLGSFCDFTGWLRLSSAADCPSPVAATAFYTDPAAIAAFEGYISVLLNHVNYYTGVPNKDNPTIMAWETGNELPYGLGGAPEFTRWTATISSYIKSIAPNQLVMDGAATLDPGDLRLPDVDIADVHLYPAYTGQLNVAASLAAAADRPLVVGEYAWNDPSHVNGGLSPFLADVYATKNVAGDLYWDLLPQNDLFGYVEHYDGYQLQFPGNSADVGGLAGGEPVLAPSSDSVQVADLRRHAYIMSGRTVPAYPAPAAPVITNVEHVASQTAGAGNLVEWRGVADAASYVLRRSSTGASGPWVTVGQVGAAATETPYLDSGAGARLPVWYQVTAVNPDGVPGPGSASFRFEDLTVDDNLSSFKQTLGRTPGVFIDTSSPELYGGDGDRADFPAGQAAQSVTWHVPGLKRFEAVGYYGSASALHLSFELSVDGRSWSGLAAANVQANQVAGTSPSDALCYIYTIDNVQGIRPDANYVRVERTGGATGVAELGEVRITYP